MYWPPVSLAIGSNGQIFMAWIPDLSQIPARRDGFGQKIDVVVASVISADGFARCAAEQLIYRQIGGFAGEIPERDIHCADGAHFGAGPAAEGDGLQHVGPQPVDLRRIAAQQHGRERTVHYGLFGFGMRIGFAETDQPLSVWMRTHNHWMGRHAR